ncbi:ATP-binding protein [Streptomyces sp. NBC_01351]|uniref:ATP-binding protein n=1 Tax=Streptomyces sp. NBC_01351 TaxID=2903833 RepID=UPI002E366AFF|nr:ATP-binding protein [Streptomyces sp. NBC_01351]
MNERRSPERSRVFVLGAEEENVVTRCRDFTKRALTDWEWLPAPDPDAEADAEDVLLLVSELVANARLHGGGPSSLLLRRTGDGLRVEVTDRSPTLPVLQSHSPPARPGGHGLRIVDRLARRWGAEPLDGGKRVWLEVSAPQRIVEGPGEERPWWSRRRAGGNGSSNGGVSRSRP